MSAISGGLGRLSVFDPRLQPPRDSSSRHKKDLPAEYDLRAILYESGPLERQESRHWPWKYWYGKSTSIDCHMPDTKY